YVNCATNVGETCSTICRFVEGKPAEKNVAGIGRVDTYHHVVPALRTAARVRCRELGPVRSTIRGLVYAQQSEPVGTLDGSVHRLRSRGRNPQSDAPNIRSGEPAGELRSECRSAVNRFV